MTNLNSVVTQAWQVSTIEKAIQKAETKHAKFFDHNRVAAWVENWDSKYDNEMPK